MKELEKIERDVEAQGIELQVRKQQQKEFKFESSLKPLRGHSVWEINRETLEVKKAEFVVKKEVHLFDALHDKNRQEIIKRPWCEYISSLNPSSALKRYKKGKGSAHLPEPKLKF